jgi:hypothetical protein
VRACGNKMGWEGEEQYVPMIPAGHGFFGKSGVS